MEREDRVEKKNRGTKVRRDEEKEGLKGIEWKIHGGRKSD